MIGLVKPERAKNNNRQRREIWWRFTRPAQDLYRAISDLDRVLVVARVSKTCLPVFASTDQVISETAVIFASSNTSDLALLSSSIHYLWARTWGSSLKGDLRYTPSDVWDTFPQPDSAKAAPLAELGSLLNETRASIMIEQNIGLTKLYNRFHDPVSVSEKINELRDIHTCIDRVVADAYGWHDLDLAYIFEPGKQGCRRIHDRATQVEITDRLLELNHSQGADGRRIKTP